MFRVQSLRRWWHWLDTLEHTLSGAIMTTARCSRTTSGLTINRAKVRRLTLGAGSDIHKHSLSMRSGALHKHSLSMRSEALQSFRTVHEVRHQCRRCCVRAFLQQDSYPWQGPLPQGCHRYAHVGWLDSEVSSTVQGANRSRTSVTGSSSSPRMTWSGCIACPSRCEYRHTIF